MHSAWGDSPARLKTTTKPDASSGSIGRETKMPDASTGSVGSDTQMPHVSSGGVGSDACGVGFRTSLGSDYKKVGVDDSSSEPEKIEYTRKTRGQVLGAFNNEWKRTYGSSTTKESRDVVSETKDLQEQQRVKFTSDRVEYMDSACSDTMTGERERS